MSRAAFLATTAFAVAALGFQLPSAYAEHSWGNYHWRTPVPDPLQLGDNVTANWEEYLRWASTDWTVSEVLNTTVGDGMSNPKNCKATDGRVEVCNSNYGFNGWLGLAQIWVSGSHITKGIAKLNDTYFDTPTYDSPDWRDMVMCQEVGHTFGLGHQDENFSNPDLKDTGGVETCMDYTSSPAYNGQPNGHDYEELGIIYNHDDKPSTVSRPGKGNGRGNGNAVAVTGFEFAAYVRDDPDDWGQAVAFTSKGQPRLFVKDLGEGEKRITHVLWTEDARAGRHFPHH